MSVETKSKAPSGNLESYETTLDAHPISEGAMVTLSVSMAVRVQVPRLFMSRANTKVQQATDDAIAVQTSSIKSFITKYSDERLIVPEL